MLINGVLLAAAAVLFTAAGSTGTWVGQDQHDFAGPSPEVKPSDVQDIHIVLDALPPERTIDHVRVVGHGADTWEYKGKWGPWAAVLQRAPGSPRADLYIEPARVESGRVFTVTIRYDDRSVSELLVRGHRADPNLRMPGAALSATWMGQEPVDWVGTGPGVGPDGLQDIRIALAGLSAGIELKELLVDGPPGARWRFGVNPEGDSNAELVRDSRDRSRADLYLQTIDDLSGQRLRITVTYAHGKTDTAVVPGGRADPARTMPPVTLPKPFAHAMTARWCGQDRCASARPGDVRVALSGIPPGRSIAAAALSDALRGHWVYRAAGVGAGTLPRVGEEAPLMLTVGSRPGEADFFFAPIRDESDRALTFRLVFSDGALAIVRFPGGSCDPALRVPPVGGTTVRAEPGDDLGELVKHHRIVRLGRGVHKRSAPLVLDRTVSLVGEPGATLLFEQGPDQPAWSTVITVHSSHTSLEGFAIRFSGPLRWKHDVPYGAAVIGATELLDGSHPDPRIALRFASLDIEAPPAANPSAWEEAPRLLRLMNAGGGRVTGNRLKGGPIEVAEGPWEVVDNDFQGTQPGTFSHCVIGAHFTHDLLIRGNKARSIAPSGKTWRFLVLTGFGSNDRIEGNVVTGIGPRDDDTIPPMNAPEIILTESYHLHFEGKPAAISTDGLIVSLGAGQPLGQPPRAGSVVAVLSGKEPGRWRRIAQVLDRVTFLLDEPLPPGTDRVSIASGFVNETIAHNTVDARGSTNAAPLILAGNHFGTRVLENHFLGAGDAFVISAYPSESPGIWGWSHAPCLDAVIAGNTIEDAEKGGTVGVYHSEYTKSNGGRTYMTVSLRENTIKWTPEFLRRMQGHGARTTPPGLSIGFRPALDPGELIVETRNNRLDAPKWATRGVACQVHAAIVNGIRTNERGYTLSPLSAPAAVKDAAGARAGGDRR